MDRYDDIIHLEHHTSPTRQRMPMAARAAQFAPFAALNGHGDAISETARLTSAQMELSDDEQAQLSRRLSYLMAHKDDPQPPRCAFTYFRPDGRKQGGCYVQACGTIKKLDSHERVLMLSDGTAIPLDCIISIRLAK